MLHMLPRAVPAWPVLVQDLGNPSPAALARALHVTPRTVQRWHACGQAPRVACLALFWLTRWGRSLVDVTAFNDAQMLAQLAASRGRQIDALQAQVQHLVRIGHFGAANDPATCAAELAGPGARCPARHPTRHTPAASE